MNVTDQKLVGVFQKNNVNVFDYIALKSIEDQRLVEFWDVYCSEIDTIPESWLMLVYIFL